MCEFALACIFRVLQIHCHNILWHSLLAVPFESWNQTGVCANKTLGCGFLYVKTEWEREKKIYNDEDLTERIQRTSNYACSWAEFFPHTFFSHSRCFCFFLAENMRISITQKISSAIKIPFLCWNAFDYFAIQTIYCYAFSSCCFCFIVCVYLYKKNLIHFFAYINADRFLVELKRK